MKIIAKYQHKLEHAGALTRFSEYKRPVYIRAETEPREPRPMNPKTPRADSTISRTRYNIYHLIRCNQSDFNVFVTLTYSDNHLDLKTAKIDFKLFILKLEYYLGIKTKYICIPERQDRGAVHFHCLFFNIPFRPLYEYKALWEHGDARFERSARLRSIASYVSKYITKNTFDFPKGTRILMRSRNLVVPTIQTDAFTPLPDVIELREPVQITTGDIKKVTIYDNHTKGSYRRKN